MIKILCDCCGDEILPDTQDNLDGRYNEVTMRGHENVQLRYRVTIKVQAVNFDEHVDIHTCNACQWAVVDKLDPQYQKGGESRMPPAQEV